MVCKMSVIALLMSMLAEFHGYIATSFPQIIDLLRYDDGYIGGRPEDVLSKLSEHGMYHTYYGITDQYCSRSAKIYWALYSQNH